MPISSIHGEIGALYFDETIGGGVAQTTTLSTVAMVAGYSGALNPGGGTGIVRPVAGSTDYIIVSQPGWYRIFYMLSGVMTTTARGVDTLVHAGVGAVSVATADILPGSECRFVGLTGNLEGILTAETYAYLKANSYVTLDQAGVATTDVYTVENGTFIVERIAP